MALFEKLHAKWTEVTGQTVNARATERIWWEFSRADYNENDLELVLRFMLRSNKRNEYQYRINVLSVVGDIEKFASIHAEAAAIERNRRKVRSEKEKVLQAWRPIVGEGGGTDSQAVKSFREVLKSVIEN